MTFVNALQVNDMLTAGLQNGIEAIVTRSRERQEIEALDYHQQLTEWQNYAVKIEQQANQLNVKLNVMMREYAKLELSYKSSDNIREGYSDYIGVLIRRIKKVDEQIQRQCANEHATQLMLDRLVEQLAAVCDRETCELLSLEKRMEIRQKDWQDFMDNNDVRHGIPLPGSKP